MKLEGGCYCGNRLAHVRFAAESGHETRGKRLPAPRCWYDYVSTIGTGTAIMTPPQRFAENYVGFPIIRCCLDQPCRPTCRDNSEQAQPRLPLLLVGLKLFFPELLRIHR